MMALMDALVLLVNKETQVPLDELVPLDRKVPLDRTVLLVATEKTVAKEPLVPVVFPEMTDSPAPLAALVPQVA